MSILCSQKKDKANSIQRKMIDIFKIKSMTQLERLTKNKYNV